ncbi:MAG TPA: response regulator transcription factor [Aggregatilinea sp.]|jgi:NarL family two-component system response regulator LiaR|uniref:response regulator transcription factor n=1 Tax=Aggregatilinea sp. TaxID=2806333 RepID=UPI002B609164|nr:response regulator transcription factor [Aggregatilinea sp.]HML22465.1 response regulator transcription factor [Aggregatilinea sp.]
MQTDRIRILIVDDHTIVRKGLRALLVTKEDLEVVGEASSGEEALAQAAALRPDVILMDLSMPGMGGIEATRQLTAEYPEIRILVLTSFVTDDLVFPAIKAGALGYLLKDSDPADLVRAIHEVYQGDSSLHPTIARMLLAELTHADTHTPPPETQVLTTREVEIARLIARGLSNRAIADQLTIAETTVRAHVSNILSKLHLASRNQVTLYVLREGLASLDDDLQHL